MSWYSLFVWKYLELKRDCIDVFSNYLCHFKASVTPCVKIVFQMGKVTLFGMLLHIQIVLTLHELLEI